MIFKTIGDGENTKVVTALQARRIAQEQLNAAIAKEEAQLQADIICLKNYEAECLKGNISTEQFKIIMSGASDSAKKFAVETKGAAGSTEVFVAKQKAVQTELKATSAAAKGTGIAMKALSVVGNMIVFTLITKGIQLATTAIDNYIHRAEKCKERVEEMISTFDSAIDTANSHKKTIDEIGSRYEELSKGVNSLGENISLTSDEYSEYNDIVNQIAEMFPSMVQGYTSEGNAILTLKGNVDALTEAYEAEAQAAYNALIATGQDSDGNDIIADWKYSLSENKGKGTNITQAIKELETFMTSDIDAEMYTALRDSASAGMYDGMTDAEKMIAGSEFLPFKIKFDLDDNGIITDEELAKAKESAKVLLQTYNAEIESDFDNVKTLANAYLMTNEDFKKLDEQSQSAASLLLNSIPATSDIAQVLMTGTKEEVGSYVNFIVQALSSDNPEVKEALINLLTLDTQDLSPDEIQSMINGYISTIAQYLHRDENELKIQLGFEDVDNVAERYNNAISQFGESGKELLSRFFKNNSINSTEEIDYWTSVTKGATDATDAINKYNRAKELTIETPNISNTEILAQIQSLSEGLDQLDKIYADVLDKEDFDWSSILNNDGFTKAFGDMQNVTDEYKSAYDDFINTITNNSNDISACQSAFDDLATAYIYNSGALDNLTIETKDATIAMLEQMGVENAKEFVESQVAITTSEIKEAQEALGISTENLTDLTIEQITQLLNEGEISDYARNHLYQLYLSQINLNNNPVDTTKTINNLLNIVGASSDAGKALAELGKIMVQISNAQEYLSTASGDTSLVEATLSGLEKRAEKIRSDATASFTSSVNVKSKYTGGSKTNSAKTNSAKTKSGSSSSAKDTAKTFDLIEIYINRISRSIDKLNKKVSNTWLSWSKRNKALKQELNKVLELQTAQEKAAKYYEKKANKITLSSDKNKDAKLKEQLRNGAIDIKTVKDEKLAEKMQQYLDYWDKVKEYTDAAADSFEQYQSLVVQKFEQIQAKYDARIGYQENRKNAVSDALNLAQSKGQLIGSAYYTKQKGINDKEISQYKKEEAELKKAMKDVPKYSEEWYNMKSKISEVHSKYVQLQADNAELQRSINELKFDRFDELINKIDDVGNECDFLKDLLSDDIFDDAGNITDDGVTAMGLTAMKGNIAASKRDYYKEQLAQLEKDYNNGNGTIGYDDYISRQREYKQGIQDSVKEINDARKATIDYVKQGLDAQNEALSKSIDKQKELLESEKD